MASLTVVGTGIRAVSQVTLEVQHAILRADKVYHLIADDIVPEWIQRLKPDAVSLRRHYSKGVPRIESYEAMVEEILQPLGEGADVCAAFYGHPGVFAYPPHEAIRRARAAGHQAKMLPGISADACLYADLGVDPARHGYQGFEATDFLLYKRVFDSRSILVLWQVGVIGVEDLPSPGCNTAGLALLVEELLPTYGSGHMVTVYEAATLPIGDAEVQNIELGRLTAAEVTPISTLLIPPLATATPDPVMALRLKAVGGGGFDP